MEQSLQEKLDLMQSVVENTPLPVGVYLGEDLTIVLANEAMIKTYGKGAGVIGKSYMEILPELEQQEIFNQARSVLRTGIPFHANNTRVDITIDGILKPHYFNYSFIPLKNSEGITYAIMNTGADVTDLSLARQHIQETEEKLRLAITTAGLGTYEADLVHGNITTSGDFHNIWGTTGTVSREDITGRIHPDDVHIRDKAHLEAQTSGTMLYEVRIIPAEGVLRWVRIIGTILKDEEGNPVTLLGIVQDISDQKQFSEELQKLVAERTAELKRSNEDLLQFANIVSHDLKEPVRKISFFNSLLKSRLGESIDEKNVAYFEKIQQSTERMTSIIEGVLNYSTLNKSGHDVKKMSLDTIIENIKTDLELIIQEKEAILVKENFPEIEGAPILIHQLFYNLIHNALKFSKPDDPPRVIISCTEEMIDGNMHVRIVVKDNGIGFDIEHAQKIFSPFERLHSKDEFEGTGLGLALCQKITERHHGTISASGNKGNGAEFIVLLPLQQQSSTL
ncbi:PAS domain-containing sensor histidine kinase [Flavobacterium magnum]|uniref:histidine kinase n=1 Tax=Flavobacterium magnum TaxID=2162713 RepID=A0A2S0RH41_9FLAO|nr:ATP-binding protein [Flavobacterium magnum]AWA30839.1 PAS domain-containing sensor histidine kinase [Flavobacterium magnum]